MQSLTDPTPPPDGANRWKFLLAGLLIALVVALAYANTYQVPFYFDDREAITDNTSITHGVWPTWDKDGLHWDAVTPPNVHVAGALGRPLVNLSLAVNYALAQKFADDHNGLDVWNYHLFNVIFHVLAAWMLLAVLRRTLLQPALTPRFGGVALPLAFFITLIWAAHPLLTEVVTCVIQRNESLVAIFYFLALYCFLRSVDSPRIRWWQAGAVAACYLGVAAKELMFSAPILILLYDRTFVAGSFRAAWRQRRIFYACLVSSWVPLAGLMLWAGQRGGTVGFGLDMPWWAYALKQCYAVPHYFQLAFWPHPLVMDYGTDVVYHLSDVWLSALILTVLVGATGWALWKRPVLGLAGAWAFIILAPSSSILPLTTQTMAEHRMYMPLIPFVAFVVLGAYRWAQQYSYLPLGALALLLAAVSFNRNKDYATELTLWTVTAKQVPHNERALYNLGWKLIDLDRYEDAVPVLKSTIALDFLYGDAHCNLGLCYIHAGNYDAAQHEFHLALWTNYEDGQSHYNFGCVYLDLGKLELARIEFQHSALFYPDYAEAHEQLGAVLLSLNEPARAITAFEDALNLNPNNTLTVINYGDALFKVGRIEEAITSYENALALGVKTGDIHKKLATALAAQGDLARAISEDGKALELAPDDEEAHYLYGSHLAKLGQNEQAAVELAKAVKLRTDYPEAENSLGSVLVLLQRYPEAEAAYKSALELKPEFAEAHFNLGTLYYHLGRMPEAEKELRSALQFNPDYAEAHNTLGGVLVEQGGFNEALVQFGEALRINPEFTDARHNLDALQAVLVNPGN